MGFSLLELVLLPVLVKGRSDRKGPLRKVKITGKLSGYGISKWQTTLLHQKMCLIH